MNGFLRVGPIVSGCALALLVACNRSGQTGSPNSDPPRYQSANRFTPRAPDGTGNPGIGNPGFGSNRPSYYPQGGQLLALLPSGHAVTAVNRRGVLVYDVSKPSDPRVVGELPLHGTFLQLNEDGDDAAPSITVAVVEDIDVDEPSVPEEPIVSSAVRLVRIDLSDPTAPVRAAQIDLEGDVWEFVRRERHYFVLSELYRPRAAVCGQEFFDESGPDPRAMRVSDYELAAGGFHLRGSLELPADSSFAYASEDGFFVPNGFFSDPQAPTLSWADFGDGTLNERGSVALRGRLLAVARRDGVLVALVQTPTNNRTLLQTFALGVQGGASERGSLELGPDQVGLELLPGAQRSWVTGGAVQLVDLGDLAQPRVMQELPADAQTLFTVPQGVLALGGSDTGHLVASLWSLPDQGSPQMLGRLASHWAWANVIEPGYRPYAVDRERGLLLAPIRIGNAELGPELGVAKFDDTGVSFYGEYALHEDAFLPLDDGDNAYLRGEQGLEVVALEEGAQQSEPSSGYSTFYPAKPIATATVAGRELSLRERAEDSRFVLEVTGGNAPTTFELDHRGDALIAVGDRAVVLGARWDSECMYRELRADPNPPPNACAPYRQRGLSVVDLRAEPRIVASFAISGDMDVEPIDGVTAETDWSGFVQLPDGRLAFPVQRRLRCSSQQSCDAIGTTASQVMAAPGCNPQLHNCEGQAPVEILTEGGKTSLLLYVLEDVAADPQLKLATELDGRFPLLPSEGPLDVGWQLLRNEHGFAFTREEQLFDENGNSLQNAHEDTIVRYFLDRIAIGDDGSLNPLPSVNTPGLPVAWRGDEVYSIEPSYRGKDEVLVSLHRSRLRGDAARIERSVEIGSGFLDAREVGDHLVVVRGPADPCADHPRTAVFTVALDESAMSKSDAIDLPGRFWGFPYGPATDLDGNVVVRGGPLLDGGHIEVDLSDPAHPSVVRYTNEPLR